jgi:hypothetical protein
MIPAVLIKRIEQELIKLRESVAQIQRLLVKVQHTGDQDYIGTIALHLHSYYNGVERILYVVAQSIDNSVPQGEDWHQQLLIQMTLPIPNIRPVLIGESAYRELNEFRGFRHVVRSNYAFELEHERVLALAQKLSIGSQAFQDDCQRFCAQLKLNKNSGS